MHGWKHTGHIHRPAPPLPARIGDHRHLGRTARGCAGGDGHPGQPPRLPQGRPAGSEHPQPRGHHAKHCSSCQPRLSCHHPAPLGAPQPSNANTPSAHHCLPPCHCFQTRRGAGKPGSELLPSPRAIGNPDPPCPQPELLLGIPEPPKRGLRWVQGHSPGRACGHLQAQEQLSLLENRTSLLGK